MRIRPERSTDLAAIDAVTLAAFADEPHSDHTETFIVAALRAAGALTVSLVADEGGEVLGHIAFSPVTIDGHPSGWYGLGPVSVAPSHQRRGIGTALVLDGLARLRVLGAAGCLLVGHPAWYPRFGFRSDHGFTLAIPGVPAEAFLVLSFGPEPARGLVAFHPAFGATA